MTIEVKEGRYFALSCGSSVRSTETNDWPDDLHLADVLDKHLGRHLEFE